MKITEKQRLMGIGVMAMIEKHYEETKKYVEFLEEWFEPDFTFSSQIADQVYGEEDYNFDNLLEKLNIEIEDEN